MPLIDQLVPEHPYAASAQAQDEPMAQLPPEWFLPTVHSVYFQIFSRMLSLPLSAAQQASLEQPRLLPLLDYLPIFDATRAAARPHDGQFLGLQVSMATHGPMGLAAITSGSIGQAMGVIARYAHIRNRLFDFGCDRHAGMVRLLIRPRVPLAEYGPFVQNVTVFAKFSILRAMAHPNDWRQGQILLPWAAPAGGEVPGSPGAPTCIYGADALGFQFPQELAERATGLSDPHLHRHVCQAADEEMERLQGSISARVRHLLHARQPLWPSVDAVADALSMSRRTLLRKLESEKISYQQLLDEARNELACWYLRQSRMPLGHIAEKMGFSDQTNFSRSFRRWKGATPKDYRKQFALQHR